ncbi:flagellar hook assembly protein FlgD [Lacipirellula sp.]|uniref:flagellar hook assembly protein FlgD n=1 Tax=Lacipirellula sp. TaxID=2691419 RepID=UPI003D0B6376
MSSIPSTGSVGNNAKNAQVGNAYNDLDMSDFMNMMIAELQNQDPMNPMDNSELISQISQMRSVAATDKMTTTLDSVLLGQNISSATSLIGAEIDALSDDLQRVTGVVERVSVADGQPKLHLDLNPKAKVTDAEGGVEAGEYEYRVVWQENGSTFAVDPLAAAAGKKLKVEEDQSSVLLSNLPETTTTKQIFRREVGAKDFNLVGQLTDPKVSTFVDSLATDDLSNLVLSGTPQMMEPKRSFTVSLKNVGEIRPPS